MDSSKWKRRPCDIGFGKLSVGSFSCQRCFLHSAERMGEGTEPSHAAAAQPRTFPGVSFKLLTWQSDANASFVHSLLQLGVFAP